MNDGGDQEKRGTEQGKAGGALAGTAADATQSNGEEQPLPKEREEMKRKLMPFLSLLPLIAIAAQARFTSAVAALRGTDLVVKFGVSGVPRGESQVTFEAS